MTRQVPPGGAGAMRALWIERLGRHVSSRHPTSSFASDPSRAAVADRGRQVR
ncbi:hypothetical protein ACPOLB_24425 [Rubrivivax sp. RP6-9]|uniref:hypothetical protein n=1 Tax=Rubrivivax sp. RP6-9 TaxID=3415750 RepID=UPI003CC6CC5B